MIDKCEITEAYHTKSLTATEAEEELEKIKKTAGVDSLDRLGNNFIQYLLSLMPFVFQIVNPNIR